MLRFSEPRIQFTLLALVLVILIGVGFLFDFEETAWVAYFQQLPLPLAGIIFIGAYVGLTSVAWLAKDLLRVVAALVFGPYWSTLFIWIGELANSVVFFHMSRKLGRAYIAEKFHLKETKLESFGGKGGVWHIFLLRSMPLVPFKVLDLGYGLTSVTFRKYCLVTAVAMPAWIFWFQLIYAALGSSVLDPARLMDYLIQNITLIRLGFIYLALSAVAMILLRKKIK